MDHNSHQHPDLTKVSSASLLERIRLHDRDAWDRFVELYVPTIYDICRRSGIQAADADDVVQEVLQSVSRGLNNFKKEREGDSFRGWLYRIVQNKIRDWFRRSVTQPPGVGGSDFNRTLDQIPEEVSDSTLSNGTFSDPALTRALDLIRNEFQERTWTAFWRLTVDRQSAADVAAALGMKINAVRQAKFRILQRLRAEFGDLIDLPD